VIEKVELQFYDGRKSLETMINDQSLDKSETPSMPASISKDSIAQIAFSLALEKKKKRNPS